MEDVPVLKGGKKGGKGRKGAKYPSSKNAVMENGAPSALSGASRLMADLAARKPKRPSTSYFIYQSELKTQLPGTNVVAKAKEAGRRWKAMSDAEKEVYHEMARQAHTQRR